MGIKWGTSTNCCQFLYYYYYKRFKVVPLDLICPPMYSYLKNISIMVTEFIMISQYEYSYIVD